MSSVRIPHRWLAAVVLVIAAAPTVKAQKELLAKEAYLSPPKEIEEAAAKLRCTAVRYLNVATRTQPKADFHWIYVPEEKFPFYRVGIYTNAVPAMAPPGRGSLYVELSDRGPMPRCCGSPGPASPTPSVGSP